jgi:hypothetical protein
MAERRVKYFSADGKTLLARGTGYELAVECHRLRGQVAQMAEELARLRAEVATNARLIDRLAESTIGISMKWNFGAYP